MQKPMRCYRSLTLIHGQENSCTGDMLGRYDNVKSMSNPLERSSSYKSCM